MSKNWIVLAVAMGALLTVPIMAQESEAGGGKVLGTVVRDNTTIAFEAANARDLSIKQLETWSQFAQQHPKVARQLGVKPSLLESAAYLKKHPELAKLFKDNIAPRVVSWTSSGERNSRKAADQF